MTTEFLFKGRDLTLKEFIYVQNSNEGDSVILKLSSQGKSHEMILYNCRKVSFSPSDWSEKNLYSLSASTDHTGDCVVKDGEEHMIYIVCSKYELR